MHISRICNQDEGYRLWCIKPKSPKFIINRDVKFSESSMLQPKKEVADAEIDHNASKQVEFEIEPPKQVQDDARGQPIQEEEQQIPDDVDVPQYLQHYSLTRDRERKQIKPLQRYGHADIVSLALLVAEDIKTQDPTIYHEAIFEQ